MSRHHMPKKPGRNPGLLCCGGKIPASDYRTSRKHERNEVDLQLKHAGVPLVVCEHDHVASSLLDLR